MPAQDQILDGRYQLLQQIGKGGAGLVFLARHLALQKYVVVKELRDTVSRSALRTEADALKNLHHPNLPQVYDFLEVSGKVYTVIDFVDGMGLDKLVAGNYQASPAEVLHWFRQLADVLVYLHGQKPALIHGDIKPENIIITPEGDAVLIDFNVSLTADTGRILGYSYDYASPEQISYAQMNARGILHEPLDTRSDIYSLGATFYRLVTGRVPAAFYPNVPALEAAPPGWSEPFLRILDTCMNPDPGLRYQSAEKLLCAVKRVRKQELHYGLYLLSQALCIVLSAGFIAGGVFCMITGVRTRALEHYTAAYNAVIETYAEGNYAEVAGDALELLNDGSYQSILHERPAQMAELLHLLGDSYYTEGSLRKAVSYYRQAIDKLLEAKEAGDSGTAGAGSAASNADISESLPFYYGDLAVAYVEYGETDKASALLEEAKTSGVSGDGLSLLEIQLAALLGDSATAAELAEEFLQSSSDAEYCLLACRAVALGCTAPADAIAWLTRAQTYGEDTDVLRLLGTAYVEQIDYVSGNTDKLLLLQRAEACYRELANRDYPAKIDVVNLAVVLRLKGAYEESMNLLEGLLLDYPEDGQVLMQLAFSADARGYTSAAGVYARRASSVLTEAAVGAADWSQLEYLLQKYGG